MLEIRVGERIKKKLHSGMQLLILYMVEKPIFHSFLFWPPSNIETDKSAAKLGATPRHIHSRYLPNLNSFMCRASHRD